MTPALIFDARSVPWIAWNDILSGSLLVAHREGTRWLVESAGELPFPLLDLAFDRRGRLHVAFALAFDHGLARRELDGEWRTFLVEGTQGQEGVAVSLDRRDRPSLLAPAIDRRGPLLARSAVDGAFELETLDPRLYLSNWPWLRFDAFGGAHAAWRASCRNEIVLATQPAVELVVLRGHVDDPRAGWSEGLLPLDTGSDLESRAFPATLTPPGEVLDDHPATGLSYYRALATDGEPLGPGLRVEKRGGGVALLLR